MMNCSNSKRVLSLAAIGAAMVVGAGAASNVGAAVDVDGYTWDYAYTGDALPTASSPAWVNGGSGGASVAGGELTIDTTVVDNRWFEINDGTEWNPVNGNVTYLQFRAKVNSQVDGSTRAGGLYLGGEGDSLLVALGTFAGNTGVWDNASNFLETVDVSQYHTYRVRFDPGNSTYALWIDDFTEGNHVASGGLFGGGASMYVGDGSGDHRGSMTWDYIAWNNSGAPVAVPEPAALSALGMGGAAIAMRRHRRHA